MKQVELQRTGSESESSQEKPFKAFFDLWRARAHRHHASRQSYSKSYEEAFASGGASMLQRRQFKIPPSFCKKNPQPGEANRWFRQAEADLRAAWKDLATYNPSHEWACFKCHQVRGPINASCAVFEIEGSILKEEVSKVGKFVRVLFER